MSQLDSEELRSFIGALMLIDKQREGRSDHISLSPELDQAWDPQMGGKVGITGGQGLPQHDSDDGRFDLDNPNNPTSTPNNPIGNAPTTLISDNSANPGHLTNSLSSFITLLFPYSYCQHRVLGSRGLLVVYVFIFYQNLRVVPHGMKGTGPRFIMRPAYLRSQFRNNTNTVSTLVPLIHLLQVLCTRYTSVAHHQALQTSG